MSLANEQLQRGLEQALEELAQTQDGEFVRQLKPILIANLHRNRVQAYVEEDPARIQAYVWFVAQTFSKLKPHLHKLQTERDTDTWKPLFENMQTWAYSYFLRKGFQADDRTREIAIECATEAAANILNARFPYDTEFDAWAHATVINACRKYIQKALKKSVVPEDKKIELTDELAIPHELLLEAKAIQNETWLELQNALEQLSEARRTAIRLVYLEELPVEEVARRMNKSVGAIYNLQFNALKDLRKILGTNRDNINE